jgi:hypothetical protein
LLLGLLAAGFVTELARIVREVTIRDWTTLPGITAPPKPGEAIPDFRSIAVRVVTVPLLLIVLFEGLPKMDHVDMPAGPAALAAARPPVLVLPTDDGIDLNVMLWSTNGFPTIANGASSVITPARQEIRDAAQTFPSQPSVAKLREVGIHSVVVVRARIAGTPYQLALDGPIDGLGITRQSIGPDVLYDIG